jgi:pilus assembly protein CpaC
MKYPYCKRKAWLALAVLSCVPPANWAQTAGVTASAPAADATASAAVVDSKNGFAEVLKPTRARPRAKPGSAIQNQLYAPIRKPDDEGQIPEIEMFVGESRVFPAPGVARIAVGNGALLTAAALDDKEVILFANGAGTSSLFIWNADGRYQRVKISIVPGDTSRHAREIAAFLSTIPNAKASVVGANIIVEGDDLSDADIVKIEELAKRYPQIVNFTNRIGWEQMVMLDVKVVEFPVTVLREIGLKWSATGGAAIGAIWKPGRRGSDGPYQINIATGEANAAPIVAPIPPGGPLHLPSALNVLSAVNLGLNAQLNLLAQEGKATLLAEPQLSARSGAKASFLAGGEIPYAVSTRDGVYIQFKTYGIKLDITPKVDHRGVVRATIQTEVSSVDRSVSTIGGPALLSRKTDTEFNLRNGETIVLSGLLQRENSSDVDKVPLLGDLPIIGAVFRSKRFQNKETELVVFVTPTVVNAQSPGMSDRIERTQQRLEQRLGTKPYLSEPTQPGIGYERPDTMAPGAIVSGSIVEPAAITPVEAASPRAIAPTDNGLAGTRPSSASPDGGSALSVVADGTALRAEPSTGSAVLMQLDAGATVLLGRADAHPPDTGAWRNVVVGGLNGWVPSDAVRPHRYAQGVGPSASAARQAQSGRGVPRPLAEAAGVAAAPRALILPPGSAHESAARRYRVRLDGLALRTTPDVNAEVLANLIAGDTVVALPQAPRGAWTAVQFGQGNQGKRGWVATQWLVPASVQ